MRNVAYRSIRFFSACMFISGSLPVCAEPQLYETGPTEESSFVRFVNATDSDVAIGTGKGKEKILNTQSDGRVTRFFKIKAGTKLAANVKGRDASAAVEVSGKPWEFITVAILPGGAHQLKTTLLRETPTEFSGSQVSLALHNLDAKCAGAIMPVQGNAYDVKPFTLQRHLIASDKQSISITCSGAGTPVDLTKLEKGERYSLFLLTSKNSRQTFIVSDDKK